MKFKMFFQGHKITSNEEDEDTKANKIAQYFEQKYATGKKRRHIRDLIDGGEGYDNTDPFVDDSECVSILNCFHKFNYKIKL